MSDTILVLEMFVFFFATNLWLYHFVYKRKNNILDVEEDFCCDD